jgi:hypothetical protein
MKPLIELKAAIVKHRTDLEAQSQRAADLADSLLALAEGVSDIERHQLEVAASRFRAVRAILHPISLNSLVPPVEDDPGHEPIA